MPAFRLITIGCPFILRAEQLGTWLGDDWLGVLENPDRALLKKIQKQPELF